MYREPVAELSGAFSAMERNSESLASPASGLPESGERQLLVSRRTAQYFRVVVAAAQSFFLGRTGCTGHLHGMPGLCSRQRRTWQWGV